MKLYDQDSVICFDVDDTIVLWGDENSRPDKGKIELTNPYTGLVSYLKPHEPHIELLKQYKGRGYHIIVWSAGGALWANEVVSKLGLGKYVDIVMSKPVKYVDDKSCESWMGSRVYIDKDDNWAKK